MSGLSSVPSASPSATPSATPSLRPPDETYCCVVAVGAGFFFAVLVPAAEPPLLLPAPALRTSPQGSFAL